MINWKFHKILINQRKIHKNNWTLFSIAHSSHEIFDHLCFFHIFNLCQLSCTSINFYLNWWWNMNNSCDFEYFTWCYILFRHLKSWYFDVLYVPRWPHISVILNDKLKIPQDIDELAQDLSKDNRKSIIGLKLTEIKHISRTIFFIKKFYRKNEFPEIWIKNKYHILKIQKKSI